MSSEPQPTSRKLTARTRAAIRFARALADALARRGRKLLEKSARLREAADRFRADPARGPDSMNERRGGRVRRRLEALVRIAAEVG